MSTIDNTTSLRFRKKQKLKDHVQACAMDLFSQKGYRATTVEQIAQSAEIAPATFFNYFPTKESVVFSGLFDVSLMQLLDRQTTEEAFITTLSKNIDIFLGLLPQKNIQLKEQYFDLINNTPELREGFVKTLSTDGVALLVTNIAAQMGRQPDDIQVRVLAGAIVGVAIAIFLDSADCTATHCVEHFRDALHELEPRFQDV